MTQRQTRTNRVRITPTDENGLPTGEPTIVECPAGHFALEAWMHVPGDPEDAVEYITTQGQQPGSAWTVGPYNPE